VIAESMRGGDAAELRNAVRGCRGLDVRESHAVWRALTEMAEKAPGFAHAATHAALEEARGLGWNKRPATVRPPRTGPAA
jgi:hypothetical protein